MADEIPVIPVPPVHPPVTQVTTTTTSNSIDNDANLNKESALFNVSIRGWLASILTITLCFMSLKTIKVEEPFSSICVFALGFYFGQKKA